MKYFGFWEGQTFIKRLITTPETRISAAQALRDPWLLNALPQELDRRLKNQTETNEVYDFTELMKVIDEQNKKQMNEKEPFK